jgi:hypothetical protein
VAAAIQARGVVALGVIEGDEEGDTRGGSFGKFHAAHDKAWKADKLGASVVVEVGSTAWERMDLDLQAVVRNYGDVQAVVAPGDHLEVLKKWMGLGDRQFQKIFSAAAKRERFLECVSIAGRHVSRREVAHIRSVVGQWSNTPLMTIPKLGACKWLDEDFLVCAHERFYMRQPMLLPERGKVCVCGKGKVSEEHLERCPNNAGHTRAHGDLRDLIALMCEMAGIETEMETSNLMQDDTRRRPGDVVLVNVELEGHPQHNKFVIDVALVEPDDGVSANRLRGADVTGAAAERNQKKKWMQEGRGEALRSLGYEFVPLIVERQGALSMSVTKFIKNVCGVACSRRKHDKGFFVHYWTAVLANAVFQDVARMKRRQVRGLIDVASRNVLSNTRIRIQDGQMSSASAEGRLLV